MTSRLSCHHHLSQHHYHRRHHRRHDNVSHHQQQQQLPFSVRLHIDIINFFTSFILAMFLRFTVLIFSTILYIFFFKNVR